MSAFEFLDSNVIIYAYSAIATQHQEAARRRVTEAIQGNGVISTQVLSEVSAALLHKVKPTLSPESVTEVLDAIGPIRTIIPDPRIVRRAIEAHVRYGLHFYDGMIIAAAERAGCKILWSEDMNPGQSYFGVTVQNPFA
ncbi:MAG TPA: PIN domain-containing protein [Bryobacteraceae bacterium]|nr:PIN domain-containing protein [Bryobacteraceae bacterium]